MHKRSLQTLVTTASRHGPLPAWCPPAPPTASVSLCLASLHGTGPRPHPYPQHPYPCHTHAHTSSQCSPPSVGPASRPGRAPPGQPGACHSQDHTPRRIYQRVGRGGGRARPGHKHTFPCSSNIRWQAPSLDLFLQGIISPFGCHLLLENRLCFHWTVLDARNSHVTGLSKASCPIERSDLSQSIPDLPGAKS